MPPIRPLPPHKGMADAVQKTSLRFFFELIVGPLCFFSFRLNLKNIVQNILSMQNYCIIFHRCFAIILKIIYLYYLYNFEISANSKLYQPGACLENHSRNLHSLLCGIFRHGILRNCHNSFSNFSPYKSPADRKSHVLDTSLRTFHSSGRQTLLSLHSYL